MLARIVDNFVAKGDEIGEHGGACSGGDAPCDLRTDEWRRRRAAPFATDYFAAAVRQPPWYSVRAVSA